MENVWCPETCEISEQSIDRDPGMCILFCILFVAKKRWDFKNCHSLQPFSSAPFRQSLSPSHLHLIGTHDWRSSPQLKCSGWQILSEIKTNTYWESIHPSSRFFVMFWYTGAGHIIRISSKSLFISLIPLKKWNLFLWVGWINAHSHLV